MLKWLVPSPALSSLWWPNVRRSWKLLHSGISKVHFPRGTCDEDSPVDPPRAVRWKNLMRLGWKSKAAASLVQTGSVRASSWALAEPGDRKQTFFWETTADTLFLKQQSVASENLHQSLGSLAGIQQPAVVLQDAFMPSHHLQPLWGPCSPHTPQPAARHAGSLPGCHRRPLHPAASPAVGTKSPSSASGRPTKL